jgi:hypothetical protein
MTHRLSRRQFLQDSLHTGLVLAAGACLAGCGFFPKSTIPAGSQPENYYLDHKEKILKDVNAFADHLQKVCTARMGEPETQTLRREMMTKFETLLQDLPYIGGGANALTDNLFESATALAFYRVMQVHGRSLDETGEMIYRSVESQMTANPMLSVAGRMSTSKMAQDRFKGEAEQSQQRQYPGDWVFNFIEGEEQTLDYGIDYIECGICKYFKDQNAAELTPYLCLADFPVSQALNTGLVRTTTLARGGDRCDFRYKMGRPMRMEWTPDFLKSGA